MPHEPNTLAYSERKYVAILIRNIHEHRTRMGRSYNDECKMMMTVNINVAMGLQRKG